MTETPGHGIWNKRCAGILLHPTSLPGPCDDRRLGSDAYRFIDFLAQTGFRVWQMLPIAPTGQHDSPYQSYSLHAGNFFLISSDSLVERGWLDSAAVDSGSKLDHEPRRLLVKALSTFDRTGRPEDRDAFEEFSNKHRYWLDDYALYCAIKQHYGEKPWWEWPESLRCRTPEGLSSARTSLHRPLRLFRFEQFVFFDQWLALRQYANQRDILLFGDLPMFPAHDSADVWAHQDFFFLDDQGKPEIVAGVPPDYFSVTGQLWGNPLYQWERLEEHGFCWWIERLRTQLVLFDLLRIDHFRGFAACWEIPASAKTAQNGRWVDTPGQELLETLQQHFGDLPLVAEDLGLITPDVNVLRDQFALPGMKVLQFAFSGDPNNPHLPYNHEPQSVVYTGTHDNNTTRGWYEELEAPERDQVIDFLGPFTEEMPWPIIRMALSSVARLAVLPMQDILGLGSRHRMNTPGTEKGNWTWRFQWEQVTPKLIDRLQLLIHIYGRSRAD
ncbi:MAG: 4-alpha-glucanotransferase [Gammaproteobacteria bacterium]|nr:4-alpha-glucanotransferase [Gammaproteobacteria bacterium]